MNLTYQALIYLIVLIITSLLNLFLIGILFGMAAFFGYIMFLYVTLPIMLLMIYHLDYIATGGSEIWSWILSILCVISMLLTTIIIIAASTLMEDDSKKTKKEHKKKDD